MNGGIANRVIITPENSPSTALTPIPARHARVSAAAPAWSPPDTRAMSQVVTTAESATRLPTDKSMPPVMMTMVMPIAMMAITTIWLATLSRLSVLRKFGQ